MHVFWWLFWIVLVMTVFSIAEVTPKSKPRRRETPLELLQRRYAAGEISSEEYTERKTKAGGGSLASQYGLTVRAICAARRAREVSCRAGNLFSTHTPVAIGFDRFALAFDRTLPG